MLWLNSLGIRRRLPGAGICQRFITASFLLLGAGSLVEAQEKSLPPDLPVGSTLPANQLDALAVPPGIASLVALSSVIFSGQVVSIVRSPTEGWLSVRFNVATGIRGTAPGLFEGKFTEGSPGTFPLWPGERLVAFLHVRNPAGFTSFIGNNCGLFERTGGDRVNLERLKICPVSRAVFATSPPEHVVFWADPRHLLSEKVSPVGSFPIVRSIKPHSVLPVSPSNGGDSMETADFLLLLSAMETSNRLSPIMQPEDLAIHSPDLSGVH